jgi:hypothetical protein
MNRRILMCLALASAACSLAAATAPGPATPATPQSAVAGDPTAGSPSYTSRLAKVDLGDLWQGEKPVLKEGSRPVPKLGGYLDGASLVSERRRAGITRFKSKPEAIAAVQHWARTVAILIEQRTVSKEHPDPWWSCSGASEPLLIVVQDNRVIWAEDAFGTSYEKVEGELWKAVDKIAAEYADKPAAKSPADKEHP